MRITIAQSAFHLWGNVVETVENTLDGKAAQAHDKAKRRCRSFQVAA